MLRIKVDNRGLLKTKQLAKVGKSKRRIQVEVNVQTIDQQQDSTFCIRSATRIRCGQSNGRWHRNGRVSKLIDLINCQIWTIYMSNDHNIMRRRMKLGKHQTRWATVSFDIHMFRLQSRDLIDWGRWATSVRCTYSDKSMTQGMSVTRRRNLRPVWMYDYWERILVDLVSSVILLWVLMINRVFCGMPVVWFTSYRSLTLHTRVRFDVRPHGEVSFLSCDGMMGMLSRDSWRGSCLQQFSVILTCSFLNACEISISAYPISEAWSRNSDRGLVSCVPLYPKASLSWAHTIHASVLIVHIRYTRRW